MAGQPWAQVGGKVDFFWLRAKLKLEQIFLLMTQVQEALLKLTSMLKGKVSLNNRFATHFLLSEILETVLFVICKLTCKLTGDWWNKNM